MLKCWVRTLTDSLSALLCGDVQVRVWDAIGWKSLALTEFIHPCVVYSAKFQPQGTEPRIVATGGLDGLLRLWDRDKGTMLITLSTTLVPQHNRYARPADVCECSSWGVTLAVSFVSHINCLVFEADGTRLYSGDGAGAVKVWACPNTGADRYTSFAHQHTISGQGAVNCLRLHPRRSRLVVHTRNNLLRTIDTKSFVEVKQYSGLRNERLMIRSDVSPDGRYIVSGSEDGQVYAALFPSSFGLLNFFEHTQLTRRL